MCCLHNLISLLSKGHLHKNPMLDGRYQDSSRHNTSQFHSNRDTGEKREEVEAPSEEAGPRVSTSKERDFYGSGKQFPKKANGKAPGNSASLRHEVTHIAPVCLPDDKGKNGGIMKRCPVREIQPSLDGVVGGGALNTMAKKVKIPYD